MHPGLWNHLPLLGIPKLHHRIQVLLNVSIKSNRHLNGTSANGPPTRIFSDKCRPAKNKRNRNEIEKIEKFEFLNAYENTSSKFEFVLCTSWNQWKCNRKAWEIVILKSLMNRQRRPRICFCLLKILFSFSKHIFPRHVSPFLFIFSSLLLGWW